MEEINKKIKLSNEIYPIFAGISDDLLFWMVIGTLFLTNVKHFSASQISSLTALSGIVVILLQSFLLKIIKKIGNIKSIKLGTILLLCSAIIITFGKNYFAILIGEMLYEIAFVFKNMANVTLRKNLKYLNETDKYISYQNKKSLIYSIITMIISVIAGILFNINNYLPMLLCIGFCIINVIMSNFFYEYNNEVQENQSKNNIKLNFTNIIILLLALQGILYPTIELAQQNGKLLIQYNLASFLEAENVAIYLSIIVTLSRISRIISNLGFSKIYKKFKNKALYLINTLLIIALILIILGNFVRMKTYGIIVMTIGFCIFLALRDPVENFINTQLLNNSDSNKHEQIITYFRLARQMGKFVISSLITLILIKVDLVYAMIFLLVISILIITVIVRKLSFLLKSIN